MAVDSGEGDPAKGGDVHMEFTLQSVVKVFNLLIAIRERGEEYVFDRVGREQTTEAFDSPRAFDRLTEKPANPFVNSGALTVVDMLPGRDSDERVHRVVTLLRQMSGNPLLEVNLKVAESEFELGERNRALCYWLRSCGLVSSSVEDLLWTYCRLCAIETDVLDLAKAGACLAKASMTESVEALPAPPTVGVVRGLMLTSGMYGGSGWYACKVGIPAKCGVSGAMIGVVPGSLGIGAYGPALDRTSNSLGGIRLMELLASTFGLSRV